MNLEQDRYIKIIDGNNNTQILSYKRFHWDHKKQDTNLHWNRKNLMAYQPLLKKKKRKIAT